MMDRIGNASQAVQTLQGLQANRSFTQANKTGSIFRQALEAELSQAEQHLAAEPTRWQAPAFTEPQTQPQQAATARPTKQPLNPQPWVNLQPLIDEVQDIAEASGFIGVTPQDIIRAYHTGQSFLADYRV